MNTPQQWLDKYTPFKGDVTTLSWEENIKLGILKWEGLKPDVLKEYDLHQHACIIKDYANNKVFEMNNCLLCEMSDVILMRKPLTTSSMCEHCPITAHRGSPCDESKDTLDEEDTPWEAATQDHNPEPMIKLLKETLAAVQASTIPLAEIEEW